MSRRERQETKNLIQQQQEKQRGLTVQLRPPVTDSSIWNRVPGPPPAWPGEPLNAPKANVYWPGPTRPSAFEIPAPSLPEVRARLDAELAHLPRQATGPLTVDEEEALDLLHALIDRIPHAQLECRVELLAQAARAAVRAIREER